MEPITAMAIGSSIFGGLGSIYGAKSSATSAKKQMAFQWLQQQQQKAWEKEKATHAHQWEMQDLKAAGLNPALTGMGGQGASAGSISAGSGTMADTTGYSAGANVLINGISQAINSAQTQQRISNETSATEAEVAKKIAETTKTSKEAGILDKYGEKEAQAKINELNTSSAKNVREANQNYSSLGRLTQDITGGIQRNIKELMNNTNSASKNKKHKTFKDILPNSAF